MMMSGTVNFVLYLIIMFVSGLKSPPERLKALEDWLQKTNTTLIQVNGQRKYGGPPQGKPVAHRPRTT